MSEHAASDVRSEHGKPVTLDRLRRIHAPGPVRVAEGEWRERLRLRESAALAMGVGR